MAISSAKPMPTKPPVAIVSPSRMRLAASSALTIFPLSSALTGTGVSRTASTDMSPPQAFASSIADLYSQRKSGCCPRNPASAGAFSVDSGQIEKRDGNEHRRGFRQRDHEHVLIGLPVSEARNSKQRDNGSIVRQCIHAAAR